MKKSLFAQIIKLPGETPVPIEGPVPQFGTLADIINKILPLLFAAAGLILFFYLISGGFDLLISAGNPEKIGKATGKIWNAILGFILIFTAWWLTQILARIFGLKGL